MTLSAIIAAGGTGTRMNAPVPKQLLELSGRTIIEWTLEPFIRCPEVSEIIIVSELSSLKRIRELLGRVPTGEKRTAVVPGGGERQQSVRNGLASVGADSDIIVVHDAVRPFVTPREITACAKAAKRYGAASLMRPVRETVKIVYNGIVTSTLDRTTVWITQTPQAFRRDLLEDVHERAEADGFTGTDDCMLVERLGIPVHVVEGSDYNIKITTSADMAVAQTILSLFEKGEKSC
ncbi:2-C-methyl-D-erythritol 4-phosphate cytidylyltransferase [Candidatus Latescibacterota bacterium]